MSDDPNGGLVRTLGRWDVLAVAFGAMIGFGWIVLTGGFLESAGTLGAALAFVIGGVVVAFVGLTYAELVSAMPHVGGEHNYVLRAMGSRPAFITSWALVLGYISVVAFEAVALPQTMLYLFPDMLAGRLWTVAGYDVYATWAAVGVVSAVVMTGLNYVGVRPAAVFQAVAVLFLLAVGAALLVGSFVGGSTENMQPLFTGGAVGLISVLVATPFLFVGFDVIPQSAEEIKLPYRKIGQLLLVSVAMAVTWYVLIMLTVGSSLPVADLAASELAAADGMAALWGSDAMATVLVLGGIAGILTSWNGFLIGASRLVYAMAQSGMLPAWFGRLHPRYRTPGNALVFIGALSVVAPLFGRQTLVWMVDAGGLSIIVAYLMVAVSFVVLRRREPDMARPFQAPGGQATGVVAAALALGLGVLFLPGMPAALIWPYEWVLLALWWALGLVFVLRLPSVGPGPDAEQRVLAARSR
ncbi:amino acid/polyamine/organocation transporter, APC superfamily [Geodermatophilus obscurus]|uniref:Amino acid/polyamine/organocation transporter, APC superfamily n=1 Tax=Geodermatophilus obscurus TaxID=1861 RepID=A0A1M7SEI9_9ACTN|nr:APC family permease [Geodermatophilus obscurus]SHN56917.1 amino acid/polyamine/organocation transporter, APC superfamily [Geodermatophilus obscurus]